MERPNANNYQHKICQEAHKKAEDMGGKVTFLDFGKFRVESCSVSDKFYFVYNNEICDEDCRAVYCEKCKICIHRYICQCPEYAVKTAICKHIHAVALFEQRSESVSGSIDTLQQKSDDNILFIDEPTTSKMHYQSELIHFVEETEESKNPSVEFKRRREVYELFNNLF